MNRYFDAQLLKIGFVGGIKICHSINPANNVPTSTLTPARYSPSPQLLGRAFRRRPIHENICWLLPCPNDNLDFTTAKLELCTKRASRRRLALGPGLDDAGVIFPEEKVTAHRPVLGARPEPASFVLGLFIHSADGGCEVGITVAFLNK